MKFLTVFKPFPLAYFMAICVFSVFPGPAIGQEEFSYSQLIQERAPWTATNSSQVVKKRLSYLNPSKQLSVVTYLHVLGEESGRKTGKHFYFVAETVRRAHYSGVPKRDIDEWLDAAAEDFNKDGDFSQAYYWGRSFLDKEDVGTAADAIKDVGALAGGKVGAGVELGGIFLKVVNETGALDWAASSTLVPFGTLDSYTPRNLDLDVAKWNIFKLTINVIDAAEDHEYRQILERAARKFNLTNASMNDSAGEILSTSPSLRSSYENMATMEMLEGLTDADAKMGAAIDNMGASVEQLISDRANEFDSLEILVQWASNQKQRRERQGEYQEAIREHRQIFAGANFALNALSLFSDSPDLQKIVTAVGVIEEFGQSAIDMAFRNISPLEMANVYVAGAKVIVNLISSIGALSFEDAVMEALAQMSGKLAEIHGDLNELRIENREAHQLTHDLLIDLHENFALHRQWSEMSAVEMEKSIRVVSSQISTANELIGQLNDEVRSGFYQLVELGKKKDFGRCVRKKEELPPSGIISSREFKDCVEDITSWIFDTENLVSGKPISSVGTVEEPSVLAAELRLNLGPDDREFLLPRTRRDIWLTSSHAYIKFLYDWPEFHVPGSVADANQRYLSEAVIENIVARGEELGRFPTKLLGLTANGSKVMFDHSQINDLTGAVIEKSSSHTSQVAQEMRESIGEFSYGIDPFASNENGAYASDLTKPLQTRQIALALEKTGFGNLSVENCFKPNGDLHSFGYEAPVALILPAALILLGVEGRVGLDACIDFSRFLWKNTTSCWPKEWSHHIPLVPDEITDPELYHMDHGFSSHEIYESCLQARSDLVEPFIGTEDGSGTTNFSYELGPNFSHELGGSVLISFSANHESDRSGAYYAVFKKDDAPPLSFRYPATGNTSWAGVLEHVQTIIDAIETVPAAAVASSNLDAASCEVRSVLQRRLLGAALEAEGAIGSPAANAASVAAKARKSLSHILWTGAIAPVIPILGETERARISEDLRWIARTSPMDREVLDGISSSDCRGHVLFVQSGDQTIDSQILAQYKELLTQRVNRIISTLEEAEIDDDLQIPDLKIARTLEELLKIQDWVVTSAAIN